MNPVIIPTTRTVEVPVDYGQKPPGWEKLTPAQKEWVLGKASDDRRPVWAVMDLGVPTDAVCRQTKADEKRSERRFVVGFVTVIVAIVVGAAWVILHTECGQSRFYRDVPDWMCP